MTPGAPERLTLAGITVVEAASMVLVPSAGTMFPVDGWLGPIPAGSGDHPSGVALFGAVYYRTREGRVLKFALVDLARDWPRFCRAAGLPALADDPRYRDPEGRRAHAQALIAELDHVFAAADASAWRARFEAHDVPFAILPTYPEIADDAQAEAAGLLPRLADGRFRTIDSPIHLPEAGKVRPRPAPAVGGA
jgi:crotonobetainyl-CoA:carnitine CoA-transferase CaiB-like acyl-CoA transferase